MLFVAIAFWVVASVAGAVSIALPTLPQEVSISLDGLAVDTCWAIAPDLVAADPSIGSEWCTSAEHLGATLPDNVQFTATGTVLWDAVDLDDVLKAATVPEVWFTISLGAIALLFLIMFSEATGTLRAGLASSVSVVFFGLLLFPEYFSARISDDMRGELVDAWQLVLIFYFGSEGTVQALKVLRPGSSAVGDLEGAAQRTPANDRAGLLGDGR